MSIELSGIVIPDEVEENKIPYDFFLYSNYIESDNIDSRKKADKLYEQFKENMYETGKDLIKRYNKDLGMYIFYISAPNYYLNLRKDANDLGHLHQEKIRYEMYDVIDLQCEVDKKRGRKLISSLAEKFYNFVIYHDMGRKKLYIYNEVEDK